MEDSVCPHGAMTTQCEKCQEFFNSIGQNIGDKFDPDKMKAAGFVSQPTIEEISLTEDISNIDDELVK